MENVFLTGKKVVLRLHTKEDIAQWFQWFNDKEVTRFLVHGCYPNTKERQKAFFKNMYAAKSDIQLAITDKVNHELVGTVGLHKIDPINSNADISIVLGNKKYWGKGLGKEAVSLMVIHAFHKLNLHKVTAGMVEDNIASYRIFLSLGFKEEARLREQNFSDGRYQDVLRLGLLKKEYVRLKKAT